MALALHTAKPRFRRSTPVSLIQVGEWKLMQFLEDGRLELYNLSSDIGESKNLAFDMPEKANGKGKGKRKAT